MPIANCKRCGRIFNRTRRDICPTCVVEEDRAYLLVRDYLRRNKDAFMHELVEATGVEATVIIHMIRDGRLILRDNANISYQCERCGSPTQSGRYCVSCSKELSEALTNASNELRNKLVEEHDGDRGKGYFTK